MPDANEAASTTNADGRLAREALPPHRYPAWIVTCGVLLGLASLYSLATGVPFLLTLAHQRRANELLVEGRFEQAAFQYEQALARCPSSKKVRIGLATAVFKTATHEDDVRGVQVLAGVSLSAHEWQQMSPLLPPDLREAFVEEKN